uniref:4-hydroxy-3-methylbut-2-enyl diphosphate reductase n=1 Tax=Anthurium amnicola TaxID=1678845 RepID=A0A1D1XF02_9ARAE
MTFIAFSSCKDRLKEEGEDQGSKGRSRDQFKAGTYCWNNVMDRSGIITNSSGTKPDSLFTELDLWLSALPQKKEIKEVGDQRGNRPLSLKVFNLRKESPIHGKAHAYQNWKAHSIPRYS